MNTQNTIPEARLIIQSSAANGVRDASLSMSWSKLFKLNNYYLDLAFEPKAIGGELAGHIIRKPPKKRPFDGYIRLLENDKLVSQWELDSSGSFILNVESFGKYQLEIVWERFRFRTPNIQLGI